MKGKKYLIRTIGDIIRLPDDETMERFMEELKKYLPMVKSQMSAIQATAEALDPEMKGKSIFAVPEELDWIDDDKGECTTNIMVDGKNELQFVIKPNETH